MQITDGSVGKAPLIKAPDARLITTPLVAEADGRYGVVLAGRFLLLLLSQRRPEKPESTATAPSRLARGAEASGGLEQHAHEDSASRTPSKRLCVRMSRGKKTAFPGR